MAAVVPAVDRAATEEGAVVYRFPKNAREEVRATLSTFRGHRIADVRVYIADEVGDAIPTRKGLSIRIEELPALRDAVDALLEAAAA